MAVDDKTFSADLDYAPEMRGWHRVRVQMWQPSTHEHWIKQHVKGEWDCWALEYFFEDSRDAMMFALVWA